MKKKCFNLLKITMLIIIVMMFTQTVTFASNVNQPEPIRVAGIDDIIGAGNNFIDKGEELADDKYTAEYFAQQFLDIGQVLVAIGVVTVLIVGVVMAVKWIVAKPDQKAKLQTQLIGLLIATVVIFGAIGIWNFVKGIMEDTETTLQGESVVQVEKV